MPAAARGEAMGLHGTALTTGIALGSPFAGAVVDAVGPRWAFVVLGAAGALLALVGLAISRRPRAAPRQQAAVPPAEVPAA